MVNNAEYFSTFILPQIKKLQNDGHYFISFITMIQAIEFLGALIDKKPLKAREQSKRRFSKAIDTLFNSNYKIHQQKDVLYDDLRNPLLHTLSSGNRFLLLSRKEAGNHKHFERVESKTVIIAEEMYNDICDAFAKFEKRNTKKLF